MTTIYDRARCALDRHLRRGSATLVDDVERVDVGRSGDVILTIGGPERRWFRFSADSIDELTPETDRDLPLARKLPALRARRSIQILSYRPGRRLVVRSGGRGNQVIVKGYRRKRDADAVRRHATAVLASDGLWLSVPRIIGRDDSLAFFVMPDLGTASFDLNGDPARYARIGMALRCFRRVAPDVSLPEHDHGAELRILDLIRDRALLAMGWLPDGWKTVRRRLGTLAGSLPFARPGLAHRDLHDGQLIDLARGVGVLDFDLLCRADRVLDVANLSAHLHLRALQQAPEFTVERATEASRNLVVGSVPIDEETFAARFRFYRSATFLRLALVYHMRPPWSHLSPELVELADHGFESAVDGAA